MKLGLYKLINFHLPNICFDFPLLVLKGIYHCWKYFYSFQGSHPNGSKTLGVFVFVKCLMVVGGACGAEGWAGFVMKTRWLELRLAEVDAPRSWGAVSKFGFGCCKNLIVKCGVADSLAWNLRKWRTVQCSESFGFVWNQRGQENWCQSQDLDFQSNHSRQMNAFFCLVSLTGFCT